MGHVPTNYETMEFSKFAGGEDISSHDLPASIDWRTKGVVSSVKNQVNTPLNCVIIEIVIECVCVC